MIVVDTSGLLAAFDADQAQHAATRRALRSPHPVLLLSPFVLAELDYLLNRRVGPAAAAGVLDQVARGALTLEPFAPSDVARAAEVVDNYADLRIGPTDASLVVLAERHQTVELLTLDERHFRAIRGPQGQPFRLLPADA